MATLSPPPPKAKTPRLPKKLRAPLAPPLERRRLQSYIGLMLGDIAAILTGFALSGYLYLGWTGAGDALLQAQLLMPVFLTIGLYNSAYSIGALQRAGEGMVRAMFALAFSATVLVFIAFYTKSSGEFSRLAFTVGIVFSALLILWLRAQLRSVVHWRCGERTVNELVIHAGGPKIAIPGAIEVNADELGLKPDLSDPHGMDRIGLALRNIDRVVVSCTPDHRADWSMILKSANVAGEVLDQSVADLGAHGARIAGGHGWLQVSTGPLGIRARAMKRAFDVTLALGALIVLAPLFAAVALAILIEDGRPVLFFQRRLGRGNRFFAMVKFRSMANDASDSDGSISTAKADARVTRVGQFIRRTSIDELPQLFNVLAGDMSVVGPRPHAIGSQAEGKLFWEVDSRYWLRHSLKPGMSGLAQIRGLRGATEFESDLADRLQADLEYVAGWSIWRDFRIAFMTLRVLRHDNAF